MRSLQYVIASACVATLAAAQISDGFEGGWNQTMWPIYAPDCNQGGSVSLDNSVAHTGKSSMKVTGGSSGYCGHIFFGTTAVPSSNDVYVRTWLRHSRPLGDQHVTFITMPDTSSKHLRVSGQMKIVEYNRESDDATLPSLSPVGIKSSVGIPTDSWHCLEYHLSLNGTIDTWYDGLSVPGLTTVNNPDAGGWGTSYKPAIRGIYFGWESYSGSTDTFWYDDIAISSRRVGCSVAES